MSSRSVAAPQEEWIPLPLHDCPKSELKELGVPAGLVRAVRGASTVEELRALALAPDLARQLEVRLLQRVAARGRGPQVDHVHTAFNREHLADLRAELVELLVALDPRQQETVDRILSGGSLRIRGVAGSGKTQVLLHALAKRLYESQRPSADLLWTFSRTLRDMGRLALQRLAGRRAARAAVETFDGWCLRYLSPGGTILGDDDPQRAQLVRKAREEARQAVSRTGAEPESPLWRRDEEFWPQELDFIRDQPLETVEEYLEVQRVGRGTRLHRAHRPLVWDVYQRYVRLLQERRVSDWRQVRVEAWRKLVATRSSRYDHVFIDEAQDLPPLALKMAAVLAGGNLTITLDGAQAIYRRGFRWKDLGQGLARTATLGACYRTTAQIAQAAERFRANEEEPIAWSVERLGPTPRAVDVAPPALEAEWVAEDVVRRLSAGAIVPGHVAVLAYKRSLVQGVAQVLRRRGLEVSAGSIDFSQDTVKVLTMSSAKGLEFPLVYIAPLWDEELFLPQRDQDPDEHQLEVERRMKVLYVAMTRARDELILVHRAGKARRVLAQLGPDRVQHEQGRVERAGRP